MPGGHGLRAQRSDALEEQAELDEPVAADAGIRRPAAALFPAEIVDHAPFELLPEIDDEMGDAQGDRHPVRVLLGLPAAAAPEIVPGAVLFREGKEVHRDPDDLPALPLEQRRGDGRIHPAAHGRRDRACVSAAVPTTATGADKAAPGSLGLGGSRGPWIASFYRSWAYDRMIAMSEFYHASEPQGTRAGDNFTGRVGTGTILRAMLRFHARVGVRLALRILAPTLTILFGLYYILRPEFFLYFAGVILFDSGPLARGAFSTLIAFAAARAAAPRICYGLGGWMRHLPSSGPLVRRMAVLSVFIAQTPVLGVLLVFAVLTAGQSPGRISVNALGLIGLGFSAAAAAVRTSRRGPRLVLGLAAGVLCASGRWALLGVGFALLWIGDRVSGPITAPKTRPAFRSFWTLFGLPTAVAGRAVGPKILIPCALSGGVLVLTQTFLWNNPVSGPTAVAAARFGGTLAAAVFLAGAASILAAKRPPWPLSRTWPRSARRRVLADALFLALPAVLLLVPLGLIEARAVPAAAACLPLLGLRAAAAVRLDRELRFGAWARVLAEGAFAAVVVCFEPWTSLVFLLLAGPALQAAISLEKRQKVSRWLELHHLSAGDPLSWSEG